jgi:ribonuclease P protein subunit POP4
MSITKDNLHMHELIGLDVRIISATDGGLVGLSGRIVDETKNTFRIEISDKVKTLQKNGCILKANVGNKEFKIEGSKLRFRPEDRIKKAKNRAVS